MNPELILNFWLDEVGPEYWYSSDESLDRLIEQKFKKTLEQILAGGHSLWLTYPSGALAYIIVLDQFSRNIFRGSKSSFASDRIAIAASKQSIKYGFDLGPDIPCPMKQSVDYFKIEGNYGYKWPKAQEAWDILFPDTPKIEQHRGLDDSMMEAAIIYELHKRGQYKP